MSRRNRTWDSMVEGEHSRKEPLEQLVNSYSEQLHISEQPVENARTSPILFEADKYSPLEKPMLDNYRFSELSSEMPSSSKCT
jgi:hypothetical protein